VPSFAALRPEQRTALITGLSLLVFRIVVLIIEVYMASLPSLAFDHLVQELEVKSMQVHIKTYCLEDGRVQQSSFARELEWFITTLRSVEIGRKHSFKIANVYFDKVTLDRLTRIGAACIATFTIAISLAQFIAN
jgi:hypothetical protein